MTTPDIKPTPKQKAALNCVRGFVQTLYETLQDTPSVRPFGPFSMFRPSEGAVSLTDAQTAEFHNVLTRLVDAFGSNKEISEPTISNAFQETIFRALDLQNRTTDDFSFRLDEALARLARLPLLPLAPHECCIGIAGLDPKTLPAKFGRVSLVAFNEYQLRRLQRTVSKAGGGSVQRQLLREHGATMLGNCFAVVTVRARDQDAALALARREVRDTVDSLNFFADQLSTKHGAVYLAEAIGHPRTSAVTVKPDGSVCWTVTRTTPLGPFSMGAISEAQRSVRTAVGMVSRLLRADRNRAEELLLTAIRTAGRATTAKRPGESFLLFAISLEALVLPQNTHEISHRLSQRVARLLAKTVAERSELSKRVKSLYGIRSKIVHRGSYEVDASDLDSIRIYAKQVIVRMLTAREVRRCTTAKELGAWWERLELR